MVPLLLNSIWIGPLIASAATTAWMFEIVIDPSVGPNDCWVTVNVKKQKLRSGIAGGQMTTTGPARRPDAEFVVTIGRSLVMPP